MRCFRCIFAAMMLLSCPRLLVAEATFRLYDGVTAYVPNTEGKDFTVRLEVRDLNLLETGPREVLVKVYDPAGKVVVREIIPDDGITSKSFLPAAGAWDHEGWYYAFCRLQGTVPMQRWSAPSAADRLAAHPKRTFSYPIKDAAKGVYRIELVGVPDHYVTLSLSPQMPFGIAGHPTWLHGSPHWLPSTAHAPGSPPKGGRSFLYAPRDPGLFMMLAEFDQPHSRRFTLSAPDGQKLFDGPVSDGFVIKQVNFTKPGLYDDQVLTLDVGPGRDDFLVNVKLLRSKDQEVTQRGEPATVAVFSPDEKTARETQGGAIYHDGRVFWHHFQVRLHDWLKKQPAEAFLVKDNAGKVLEPKPGSNRDKVYPGLAQRPGFLNVNDLYWGAPLCDSIMHHYPAHKNRQTLNMAIRDLAGGLRSVGPGDIPAVAVGGPYANMAYEYSNYAWQYWRPGWRLLKQADTPAEVKEILQDAYLLCGDRLAFCVTWARTNGNSFAQVVAALRYCQEGTGDPLQKKLFDTYFQRFTTGGWGERSGIGKSGFCQESFGYDHHYGSYILGTWKAILADLGDERFQKVHDRIRTGYSYTISDEVAACPWGSRTEHQPHWDMEKTGKFAWKGLPGPNFTVSVNDGNEWFAARRPGYYVLTYHGRITPSFVGAAFAGQIGYGGGTICQVHVPGKGLVLASTLNGSYGEGMHPSKWRNFHLHSVVGQTVDGKPLVGANSEHDDARLEGATVSSSGAVRESTVTITRSYTFAKDEIRCTVSLKETGFNKLLGLWIPNDERGKVSECWEMLPYLPHKAGKPGKKKPAEAKSIKLLKAGKEIDAIGDAVADSLVIDRGGFGVRIELDRPRLIRRGKQATLLIALCEGPTPASKISMSYRIIPFGGQ